MRPSAPDEEDEYLFYRTIVGIWPPGAAAPSEHLSERLSAYMVKAVHEAKRHSSWTNPNEAYDDAVACFVAAALDATRSAAFLRELLAFVNQVERPGLWNAGAVGGDLSQQRTDRDGLTLGRVDLDDRSSTPARGPRHRPCRSRSQPASRRR